MRLLGLGESCSKLSAANGDRVHLRAHAEAAQQVLGVNI
jgi:hypothetical protein